MEDVAVVIFYIQSMACAYMGIVLKTRAAQVQVKRQTPQKALDSNTDGACEV